MQPRSTDGPVRVLAKSVTDPVLCSRDRAPMCKSVRQARQRPAVDVHKTQRTRPQGLTERLVERR